MEIKLFATAFRTSVDDQFKGEFTVTNEIGDQVKIEYICTNPESELVDLYFTEKDESFHLKGIPSVELFSPFTDRQKWIITFYMNLVPETIYHAKVLSHDTTQIMRLFESDISASGSVTLEIPDNVYQGIFEAEILENQKLETIQKKTGVPLRLLKKAKYSSFPDWGANLTLDEVEKAYENAPEEGEEKEDVKLLSIVKRLIALKS